MLLRRTLLLPTLGVLTSGGLLAQASTDYDSPEVSYDGGSLTDWGRTATGQLTSDAHVDGVSIVTDAGQRTAYLLYGLGAYGGTFPTGLDASELDTSRGASPDGLDAIVSSGSTGAHLTWVDAATNSFESVSLTLDPNGQAPATALDDARRIRGTDLNRNGTPGAVILYADGSGFHWQRDIALTLNGSTWSVGAGFEIPKHPSGGEIFDFVPADISAHPLVNDLVCLEAGAVTYLRADYTRTVLATFTGTPVALTAFRHAADPVTRIAVVYRNAGQDFLLVCNGTSGVDSYSTALALNGEAVSIAAADADNDGYADLLICSTNDNDLYQFNHSGAPSTPYAPGSPLLIDTGSQSSTASYGEIGVVDYDGDASFDLVVPLSGSQGVVTARNLSSGQDIEAPIHQDSTFAYIFASDGFTVEGYDYRLYFESPPTLPSQFDALELSIWPMWIDGANANKLEQDVAHLVYLPIDGNGESVFEFSLNNIEVSQYLWNYYARYVERDSATDEILSAGRTMNRAIGAFDPAFLLSLAQGNNSQLHDADNHGQGPAGGVGFGGGTGDVPVTPPPDWGNDPLPGPGNSGTGGGGTGTGGSGSGG